MKHIYWTVSVFFVVGLAAGFHYQPKIEYRSVNNHCDESENLDKQLNCVMNEIDEIEKLNNQLMDEAYKCGFFCRILK